MKRSLNNLRTLCSSCKRRKGSFAALNQAGAALLTVLVAIMLMSLLLFEFQYSAMVERKLAYNELNQLQAYYLSKSGARIGMLRVLIYMKAKRHPTVTGSQIPLNAYLDKIWQLPLPPFPPDAALVKELSGSDKSDAEKALKQTKIEEGTFTHVISSESSKINLNFLRLPTAELASTTRIDFNCRDAQNKLYLYVGCTLINLLDGFLKESEDPNNEYPELRPEEFVLNIMDWVNPGSNSFLGGVKDTFYERQSPPYRAKRDRFYTLEELRLVKGVDEKILNKLKPHITVFSEQGKININTANTRIYQALFPDFTEDDLKRLVEDRDKLGGWATEDQFKEYVVKDLNRSGFERLYPDKNNYPFTTNTESFLIESVGKLERSGSSIQKMIRISLATTSAKGGTTDSSLTDQAQCSAAQGRFWSAIGDCKWKPTNDSECLNLAGKPVPPQQGQTYCCELPKFPMGTGVGIQCLKSEETSAFAKAGNLKVLSWSES